MRSLTKRFVVSNRVLVAICCLAVVLFALILAARVGASSLTPERGERLITLHDGGQERGILTKADTLREAFKEADIKIDEHDLIEPGLDEELVASHYEANVYRARPVTIVDGQHRKKVITPYQTPKQIVKDAGFELRDEDETTLLPNADIIAEGAGLSLTIDRATEFTLVLYGKKTTAYTQGTTVADMLEEKDIKLGEKDSLSVSHDTSMKEGMKVEIWRNGKQTITEKEAVAFSVKQIQDADRPAGYRDVKTPGVKGEKMVTYEIIIKNGKEVERKEIQSVVTKKPKQQVEVVGAKFNYTGGPLSEKQINALGQCESGMNPATNTGNGFSGAFQFMHSTWQNNAPAPYNKGAAHQAPLEAQKQAVQNLLSRSSIYTQFPSCARQMQAQGIL